MTRADGELKATALSTKRPKRPQTEATTATTRSARRRPSQARPQTDEETRTTPPLQVPLLGSTRPRAARRHAPLPQAPAHDAFPRRLLRRRDADHAAARAHAHGAHFGGGL